MATRVMNHTNALLAERWAQSAGKLRALAEAISADRYDWKPVEGARSTAEALRHVAYWNHYIAATLRGERADDSRNELPAAKLKTKDAILAALDDSATAVTRAMGNAADSSAVIAYLEHNAEHHGQLAVYCRLQGSVPPASRG